MSTSTKSWEEFHALRAAADRDGRVRPNEYHYFADRFAPTYASPNDCRRHAERQAARAREQAQEAASREATARAWEQWYREMDPMPTWLLNLAAWWRNNPWHAARIIAMGVATLVAVLLLATA